MGCSVVTLVIVARCAFDSVQNGRFERAFEWVRVGGDRPTARLARRPQTHPPDMAASHGRLVGPSEARRAHPAAAHHPRGVQDRRGLATGRGCAADRGRGLPPGAARACRQRRGLTVLEWPATAGAFAGLRPGEETSLRAGVRRSGLLVAAVRVVSVFSLAPLDVRLCRPTPVLQYHAELRGLDDDPLNRPGAERLVRVMRSKVQRAAE